MNQLLIFAKYPEPGRVKTRLAARIGKEQAALFYRKMVEDVLRKTRPRNEVYERILYYHPPERHQEFKKWLSLSEQRRQQGTDLGERMLAALQESLEAASAAVLIGTDCPDIDEQLIERAFAALTRHDLVLGPACDGGYYLIGCNKMYPQLFQGIRWSTEKVLEQTLERARALDLEIHLLPTLTDIDE